MPLILKPLPCDSPCDSPSFPLRGKVRDSLAYPYGQAVVSLVI